MPFGSLIPARAAQEPSVRLLEDQGVERGGAWARGATSSDAEGPGGPMSRHQPGAEDTGSQSSSRIHESILLSLMRALPRWWWWGGGYGEGGAMRLRPRARAGGMEQVRGQSRREADQV